MASMKFIYRITHEDERHRMWEKVSSPQQLIGEEDAKKIQSLPRQTRRLKESSTLCSEYGGWIYFRVSDEACHSQFICPEALLLIMLICYFFPEG
jgi:meiotically up-regulated gene 157 (Mug157) protein